MKKVVTYILVFISMTSIFLASGIKDVANWWDIAKPFFAVWFIALVAALTIHNFNYVRRVTYPVFVCICSWVYKHKILKTKFTHNTYKLYKWQNRSYRNLYMYVQNLFDVYVAGLKNG